MADKTTRKLNWVILYSAPDPEFWGGEIGYVDADDKACILGDANGWHNEVVEQARAGEFNRTGTIRDLLLDADKFDCLEDTERWLRSASAIPGLVEFTLHIYGVTDATKQRIHRLAESI